MRSYLYGLVSPAPAALPLPNSWILPPPTVRTTCPATVPTVDGARTPPPDSTTTGIPHRFTRWFLPFPRYYHTCTAFSAARRHTRTFWNKPHARTLPPFLRCYHHLPAYRTTARFVCHWTACIYFFLSAACYLSFMGWRMPCTTLPFHTYHHTTTADCLQTYCTPHFHTLNTCHHLPTFVSCTPYYRTCTFCCYYISTPGQNMLFYTQLDCLYVPHTATTTTYTHILPVPDCYIPFLLLHKVYFTFPLLLSSIYFSLPLVFSLIFTFSLSSINISGASLLFLELSRINPFL